MKETFYELYKASRDMVESRRHTKNLQPFQDFVDSIESGLKLLDKSNPIYYERWKKERFDQNNSINVD